MSWIVSDLKRKGILAINKRNADYTLKYNPRRLYPLVDDKLRTKQLALDNGIGVPPLYGVVEVEGQVRRVLENVRDKTDFVIKPAHGSGGEGILVIGGRTNGKFRKASGTIITSEEIRHHVYNTLSGLYSLGGQPDKAIIEYRVQFDPTFEHISYLGVPDIRIIVFLGVPVMSMVRLPTRMSDGKANLHQGAVGAGINIPTGTTISAVWENDIVEEHPDTGYPVVGVTIPNWKDLLEMAAKCHDMTGLGYQGVDIVLDRDMGPLVLELNARPGLNIQIANKAGLLKRLDAVEKHRDSLKSLSDRISFALDNF
ncbi:MAG: alpha-L-glutamate ligase-like protein [Desulfomonilaceae bacterium]|nr:alpha-L-glutamate ligase-like protein [Desulfomonilaceae bacterium]